MTVKVTIEREGKVIEVVEARGYLAAGLGETTDEGTSMHQMMVADGIDEKELIVLLSTVVGTIYKTVKHPELAEAIIASAVAKAKLTKARDDIESELEEEEE